MVFAKKKCFTMSGHGEGKTGILLKKNHKEKWGKWRYGGGVVNEPNFAMGKCFDSK